MLGKLCVCGHEMKPQRKQTLEMNGSSLGSNLWTDHVEVDINELYFLQRRLNSLSKS